MLIYLKHCPLIHFLQMADKENLNDLLFDLEIGFLHRMIWVVLFVHMYSKVYSSAMNVVITIIITIALLYLS